MSDHRLSDEKLEEVRNTLARIQGCERALQEILAREESER